MLSLFQLVYTCSWLCYIPLISSGWSPRDLLLAVFYSNSKRYSMSHHSTVSETLLKLLRPAPAYNYTLTQAPPLIIFMKQRTPRSQNVSSHVAVQLFVPLWVSPGTWETSSMWRHLLSNQTLMEYYQLKSNLSCSTIAWMYIVMWTIILWIRIGLPNLEDLYTPSLRSLAVFSSFQICILQAHFAAIISHFLPPPSFLLERLNDRWVRPSWHSRQNRLYSAVQERF